MRIYVLKVIFDHYKRFFFFFYASCFNHTALTDVQYLSINDVMTRESDRLCLCVPPDYSSLVE